MDYSSDAIATSSHLILESYLQDFFLLLEIHCTLNQPKIDWGKTTVVVLKQPEKYTTSGPYTRSMLKIDVR